MTNNREENTENEAPAQEESGGSGCLKWGLIGCGGLLVIVLIAAVSLFMFRSQIKNFVVDWSVNKFENSVMENLPEDVDQKEVKEQIGKVKRGVKNGNIGREDITKLGNYVSEAMSDGELDKKEVKGLDELIDKLLEEQKQSQAAPETS